VTDTNGKLTSGIDREAPAQVFSLSEYLCEEILARDWTTDDVAVRMGGDPAIDLFVVDTIISVPEEQLIINDDTFKGLARAFGVSEEFFRNIHAEWNRWPDRRSPFNAPDAVFSEISKGAFRP
jgi:hypothetical protein